MSQPHDKNKKKRPRWRTKKRMVPAGAAPGTMHVDPTADETIIRVITANNGSFVDREHVSIAQLEQMLESPSWIWIDVSGLGTESSLKRIAELVKIHPLAMEDVLHVNQRAKVDQFGDSLFVVARMIDGTDARDSEQISFILRPNILVSFQQRHGDCWDPVRIRIRDGKNAFRSHSIDYLLYALLDSIIDSYFPFIDQLADQLDHIDESITLGLEDGAFDKLHQLRSQLLALRRVIRPHRDMVNQLIRDDYDLIVPETRIFLRDCYDHVIHVSDSTDTYNEAANGIRDYHMSMVSNRMNEIMKVLTIMSSIFIPLSFVVGLYGMNFNTDLPGNMPELNIPHSYEYLLLFMACAAVGMLLYFRKKKWI